MVGKQPRGRMYVETEVAGNQATADTREDTVYMAKELADKISLLYKKKRYVEEVHSKRLPIYRVTHFGY